MKVRDLNVAAKKLQQNGSAGSANYLSGVQSNTNWAQQTEASAPNWAAGVQAAVSSGKFSKGVAKTGQSGWQQGVQSKGQANFQASMSRPATTAKWLSNFQPFATALAGITAPPKGVRGSPGNYGIVQTIGDTLHKVKAGQ